jgi:methylated-DNA-protein-cysteine methyltransferase-like protein
MKYKDIYDLVRQVPIGSVTTYGIIALKTGNIRRSRVIGHALMRCKDKTVPCHRVVRKDGSLSPVFGVNGSEYQRRLLIEECVPFNKNGKVDLSACLFIFND